MAAEEAVTGSRPSDQITDSPLELTTRVETSPNSLLLGGRAACTERGREEHGRPDQIRLPTYRVDLYACPRYKPKHPLLVLVVVGRPSTTSVQRASWCCGASGKKSAGPWILPTRRRRRCTVTAVSCGTVINRVVKVKPANGTRRQEAGRDAVTTRARWAKQLGQPLLYSAPPPSSSLASCCRAEPQLLRLPPMRRRRRRQPARALLVLISMGGTVRYQSSSPAGAALLARSPTSRRRATDRPGRRRGEARALCCLAGRSGSVARRHVAGPPGRPCA